MLKNVIIKLIKVIRNSKISKRLIVSFLIISIIPSVLFLIVVNKTTTDLIRENIVSNDKVVSKLITQAVGDYISKFDSITNEIIWDNKLFNNLRDFNELSNKEKSDFHEELSELINSRTTYISDVADFTIFSSDFETVYNKGFSYVSSDIKLKLISEGIIENNLSYWTSFKQGLSNYIATTMPIKVQKNTYGYVFLALKEDVLLDMFNNYNEDFGGSGFIIDDNNNIITTNNKYINEENINDKNIIVKDNNNLKINIKQIEEKKQIDKSSSIVSINKSKYILTHRPISYASWTLVGIIPYEYIYYSCEPIYIVYFIATLFAVGISIFIAYLIYKSIINPLNEILWTMNSVSEDYIGNEMTISGNDEISYIMKKYNIMQKKIKYLIDTVKRREKEKREVTLRMLQAQINPHFLFNTLGSLRYVAIMNKDKVVASGLESLSKLLRSSIINKDEFVSIEEELENVKNYINIQKIRYSDIFTIEYEIDESLLNEKMLKFILQPIVENCILHGFGENSESNYIFIKVYEEKEFINFSITDNGVGIHNDKLEQGNFNIEKFAGIGIRNIKERLNLYYEGVFVFEIKSQDKSGTNTKIIIPKIRGEK